jgi:hypothetical protein
MLSQNLVMYLGRRSQLDNNLATCASPCNIERLFEGPDMSSLE